MPPSTGVSIALDGEEFQGPASQVIEFVRGALCGGLAVRPRSAKMLSRMRWGYGLALTLAFAVAVACGGGGTPPPGDSVSPDPSPSGYLPSPGVSDEEAVREASSLAESLLNQGDGAALYDLYSESFRSQCSRERFIRAVNVLQQIRGASPEETVEVVTVTVEGSAATVQVMRTTEGGEPRPDELLLVKERDGWFVKGDEDFLVTCRGEVLQSDLSAEAFGATAVIFTRFLSTPRPEAVRELHESSLTDRFRSACSAPELLSALSDARLELIFQLASALWEVRVEGDRVEFTTPSVHPVGVVLAVAVEKQDGEWLVDGLAGVSEC